MTCAPYFLDPFWTGHQLKTGWQSKLAQKIAEWGFAIHRLEERVEVQSREIRLAGIHGAARKGRAVANMELSAKTLARQ